MTQNIMFNKIIFTKEWVLIHEIYKFFYFLLIIIHFLLDKNYYFPYLYIKNSLNCTSLKHFFFNSIFNPSYPLSFFYMHTINKKQIFVFIDCVMSVYQCYRLYFIMVN